MFMEETPALQSRPRSLNGHDLPLIDRVCEALNAHGVCYCHWKSNWKLDRWVQGEGDLDLLVDRSDTSAFISILTGLGFKQADPPAERVVPGIVSYYGYDPVCRRFVHVHAHYQLVLGHDLTKNYHLPLERAYLRSATRKGLVPTPAPEFELVVFVIRMVLKYSWWEAVLRKPAPGLSEAQKELVHLQSQTRPGGVAEVLRTHLPFLSPSLFERCVQSLAREATHGARLAVSRELHTALASQARRPEAADVALKVQRRVVGLIRTRLLRHSPRRHLATTGAIIAIVGGDGSGKTTAANELYRMLSKKFDTRRIHLGKPPRSLATAAWLTASKLVRKIGGGSEQRSETAAPTFAGYLALIRSVCIARDRYRLYIWARRHASAGGLVVSDRYPLPQIRLMDAPSAERLAAGKDNWLVRALCRAEAAYYRRILPPDVLVLLRLHPETAVARKPGEPESHVRSRSEEIWQLDRDALGAHVIEASQSLDQVLSELYNVVWSEL